VLYGNSKLSAWLRNNFVLHWKSTRPVPKITIDFGDGRVLERTITGNAFHYVLDSNGRFADAIPGLMGAEPFKAAVNKARLFAVRSTSLDDDAYASARSEWHARQYDNNLVRWNEDLSAVDGSTSRKQPEHPSATDAISRAFGKDSIEGTVVRKITPDAESAIRRAPTKTAAQAPVLDATRPPASTAVDRATGKRRAEAPVVNAVQPPAADAVRRATGKGLVEGPIIRQLTQERTARESTVTVSTTTYAGLLERTESLGWESFAASMVDRVRLDPSSRSIVERHNPELALKAIALAGSKMRVEDPMARMIGTFESSLAVDTVRNEYEFHTLIHERVRDGELERDLEEITEWIYAEIFLTPSDDPWLGLAPTDAYTGIAGAGLKTK
jgi:hypothetical protein